MRRSLIMKCVITMTLMVATWVLTATILRGTSHPADFPIPDQKFAGTLEEFKAKFGGVKPFNGPPPISNGSLNSGEIHLGDDGMVHISAKVTLFDSGKSKSSYFWRVRTLHIPDPTIKQSPDPRVLKTVQDHVYADQEFQVKDGTTLTPTFQDAMTLPPGHYFVVVSLYKMPVAANHAELLVDDDKARCYSWLRFHQKITILPPM